MKKKSQYIIDFLPEAFLNNNILRKYERFIDGIPTYFLYFLMGYEVRLDDESRSFDLMLSISVLGYRSLDILNRMREEFPNSKVISDELSALIKSNIDTMNDSKKQFIENIWFEYDAENIDELRPGVFYSIPINDNKYNTYKLLTCLNENLVIKLNAELYSQFNEILSRLPKKIYCANIGYMFSRKGHFFRCLLVGMNADQIAEILEKIGWNGNFELIDKLLINISELFNIFALQIEISENGLTDNLGIEVSLSHDSDVTLYSQAIEKLMKEYDLNIDKSLAVKDFPCVKKLDDKISIIMDNEQLLAEKLKQGLHHYKFSIKNNDITSVKAYLWREFFWQKKPV